MKKSSVFLAALFVSGLVAHPVQAQTTSASSKFVAPPPPDRFLFYKTADSGVAKPVRWGMDAGGWTNNDIWAGGVNYVGAENLTITRVPTLPVDAITGDTLTKRQKDFMKERLNMIAATGHPMQIMLNPSDGEDVNYYPRNSVGYARYARLMELSKNYMESFGHTVVSLPGYNEPDPGYANVTKQNFYDYIAACKARPALSGLRFCGGNTLDNSNALSWYNYSIPAGLNEGNTHQLAGSFDTYASFYQTVKANGHYATNDEVHNIMEGIVGSEYGLQAGIYWGYANLARGQFSQASYTGKRLGYAEHRPNFMAAAVYRKANGELRAFAGASERQAVKTTFSYVSKDRDVYYEGYGPQREYSLAMPAGNGYAVNQPNAERVVNITYGDDIQPAINGQYVLVNRKSGKVLEIPNGSTTNGTPLQLNTYGNTSYQRWNVTPVTPIYFDFSYFNIIGANTNKSVDISGASRVEGSEVAAYDNANGDNQWFFFDYAGDGYFYIRVLHSSKCLDVKNGSTANGALIIQNTKNDNSLSQQWRLMPIDAVIEFTAPAAPANLVATARPESVLLNWTANTEADVTGYNIYRSESASGTFNTIARNIAGTSFVDNTTTENGQYFYKIKAVDKALNRSGYSSQAAATTTGTKDLVAYLPFNGNALDSSVNLNHSGAFAAPGYAAGKVGSGSVSLNGTTQFIQLPAVVANQQEITVAAWVYWNGGNTWQRIFDFGNGTDQYMFLTPNSNAGTCRFAIKNGGGEQILESSSTLPIGVWSHVAVTLGSAGAKLYVNGQTVAQSTSVSIRPIDFKPVLNYIGRGQYADPLFKGNIDEFKVYNYALSPIEVANLGSENIYFQVRNRATGMNLDGRGNTSYGANAGQWANTASTNLQWDLIEISNGFYQLQNRTSGLLLDGKGSTTSGSVCGQWYNMVHLNLQWSVEPVDATFYRLRNRASGLYLDGLGRTDNGADVFQSINVASTNAQWNFINVTSNQTVSRTAQTSVTSTNPTATETAQGAEVVSLYPNPVSKSLIIRLNKNATAAQARIFSFSGQLVTTLRLSGFDNRVDVSRWPAGVYTVEVTNGSQTTRTRLVKQ